MTDISRRVNWLAAVLFTLGLAVADSPPPPLISGAESKWNGGRQPCCLALFAPRPLPDMDAPVLKEQRELIMLLPSPLLRRRADAAVGPAGPSWLPTLWLSS